MLHIATKKDAKGNLIVTKVTDNVDEINSYINVHPSTIEHIDGVMYYNEVEKEEKVIDEDVNTRTIFGFKIKSMAKLVQFLTSEGYIYWSEDGDKVFNIHKLKRRLNDAKLSVHIDNSNRDYIIPMEEIANVITVFAKKDLLLKSVVDFDDHINFKELEEILNQVRLVIENPSLIPDTSDKFLGIGLDTWNKIYCTCYAEALLDSTGNINIDEICRRIKNNG